MLHILNGDAVLPQFRKAEIAGEPVIWREALCTGLVSFQVGTETWLQQRLQYLQSDLNHAATHPIASQLQKIVNSLDNEVVLWFDYDLFCQINQMAALAYLIQTQRKGRISLANTQRRNQPGKDLSHMHPEEWHAAFSQRYEVSASPVNFTLSFWKHYCSNDHRPLFQMIRRTPAVFPHLNHALLAHCGRFPRRATGMSDYEKTVLGILSSGPVPEKELLRTLFAKTHWIGYGDRQHMHHLRRMHRLVEKPDVYRLTPDGFSALKSLANPDWISREEIYGGCREDRHHAEDLLDLVESM